MKKNKYYNVFIIIFILLPFFFPVGIKTIFPFFNKIITIWEFVSLAIVIYLYIKYKKISLNIFYILTFCFFMFISTILSDYGDVSSCFATIISIITPCMLIDYVFKKNSLLVIRSLNLLFEIFVYLNLISIIIFPNGMYVSSITGYSENWILGYDNMHIFTILLSIVFSVLYSYMRFSKISFRSFCCISACVISVLIRWSGTAVISIMLILLFLILKKYMSKIKIFNIKTYLIISIIMFTGIVIYNSQNLFISFITNFLKKDITFTGRTYIWNYIIDYIKMNPLLGYGIEYSVYRYNKSSIWRSYHAHNQFLELTYIGGFALLIIFLIIIFNIAKKLYKYRYTQESKFLSWMFLIMFVVMLTEVYTISLLFLFIIVVMNIQFIIKEEKGE